MTDVNQWHTWQDDIEYAKLDGEFKSGNVFRFKPKGGPRINIELTKVEPNSRFVEDGLVLRAQSSSDSRATNVRFTARGRKVIQRAIVAIENADEEFFSCLTEKQLQTYKSLTTSITANNG